MAHVLLQLRLINVVFVCPRACNAPHYWPFVEGIHRWPMWFRMAFVIHCITQASQNCEYYMKHGSVEWVCVLIGPWIPNMYGKMNDRITIQYGSIKQYIAWSAALNNGEKHISKDTARLVFCVLITWASPRSVRKYKICVTYFSLVGVSLIRFNSYPTSAAYIRQWIGSALV